MYVGNIAVHDALARAAPGIIDTEPYVDDDYVDDDYAELAPVIQLAPAAEPETLRPAAFFDWFDWDRSETVRAYRWLRNKLWRRSAA